jgi:hypothetical protein
MSLGIGGDWGSQTTKCDRLRHYLLHSYCHLPRFERRGGFVLKISIWELRGPACWRTFSGRVAGITAFVCNALSSFRLR